MEKQELALINVLREAVDTDFAARFSLDGEEATALCRLARRMDVAHILAYVFEKRGMLQTGTPLGDFLSREQMQAIFRHEGLEHETARLNALLEEAGIAFVLLKGACIRAYYPEPYLRTSCDIDILVHEAELERASALIAERLGYRAEEKRDYHDISLYSEGGVHLELHFSICENMPASDKLLSRVWEFTSPVREGACQREMTPEFFLFHQLAHMAYHFLMGGCGLRPFMDYYLLTRDMPYERDVYLSYCRETTLLDFCRAVEETVACWFEGAPESEAAAAIAAYILRGGVYGDAENKVAVARQKHKGRLSYILHRIFMPLSEMRIRYPVLRRHAYLLPVFWGWRILQLLFGGGVRRTLGEAKISNELTDQKSSETARLLSLVGLTSK